MASINDNPRVKAKIDALNNEALRSTALEIYELNNKDVSVFDEVQWELPRKRLLKQLLKIRGNLLREQPHPKEEQRSKYPYWLHFIIEVIFTR